MRCLSIGHPVKHELFFPLACHSLPLSLSIRLTKKRCKHFQTSIQSYTHFHRQQTREQDLKKNAEQIYVNQIKLQQKPTELF